MEYKLFIDKDHKEEITIYAHEKTELIKSIEQLLQGSSTLLGYKEREAYPLLKKDIYCFISEGNKCFALTENDKFFIRERLFKIEEQFSDFIRINQSCIINKSFIKRFDATVSGSLKVCLKNGYCDYVSRRNLKTVKERLGL